MELSAFFGKIPYMYRNEKTGEVMYEKDIIDWKK